MNVLKQVIYNYKGFWGGVFSTIFTPALIYLFRNFINKVREKQIHINIREKSVVDYTIVKKMSDCSPWERVGYCFVCMSKYLIDSFWLIVFFNVLFDESLRQLLLRYFIKVENEIKSQVSYYFTEKNGENQKEYLDTANYNYVGKKNQSRLDIDKIADVIKDQINPLFNVLG